MIQNENLLDAIGMIDEEAISDAKVYPRSKRLIHRAALLAACLSMLAIGTAFAAAMIWGVFPKGTRDDPNNDRLELFELAMEGTICFELDEILSDIAVLAEERDNSPNRPISGRVNVAAFESWEAAAEYIGVPLANNSVLEQYPQNESLVGPTVDEDGNPIFLYVSTDYLVDDIMVCVNAYLRTNHAGDESLYTPGISYDFSSEKVVHQKFQMSDGSPGVIFKCFEDSAASYYGAFILDGVFYWVSLDSDNGQDDVLEELLENVMAAYE